MNTNLVAVLVEKIQNIEKQLNGFVTHDEFAPVKAIVYGLVSLMLITMAGALLKLILIK